MKGDVTKPVRLWFWLHAMDALVFVGLFGSRAYYWAVTRAADCEEW